MQSPIDSTERLAALVGRAPRRASDVRSLARFAANSECKLAAVGFAGRVDFDRLLTGTRYEVPYGQSPFAFRRGNRFEAGLREDGYAPLLGLFAAHLGHPAEGAQVANLRVGFEESYEGMAARARETANLIRAIARGASGAPNLIDGAVLTCEVGGVRAYFEADAVAARFGAPIHVGEVKSFPTVDGQADPEKVGAAVSQVAIYILLLRDLVAYVGAKPDIVSTRALLITPSNTGLRPTMTVKEVGREVDRARRILTQAPSAEELGGALSGDLPTFEEAADRSAPEGARVEAVNRLADHAGTAYRPECLSSCGLSRLCRERAHASGDPMRVGGAMARLLPGVESLDRARELAEGEAPRPGEAPAAEQLIRAARWRARFAGGGSPS